MADAAASRPAVGVTAARGFRAAAVACGIRKSGDDLALVVSDTPASAACVFTTNLVQAAPIVVSRQALARGGSTARAILANAGNANACTGEVGLEAARRSAREAARLLGTPESHVLVASTGVIGQRLPVERILGALPSLVAKLSPDGGATVARAIMTTDTRPKESSRRVTIGRKAYTIGATAKGSGMIHPNLATTLAFVTTDAAVPAATLQRCLGWAADLTFNRISVDGDTSTNDVIAVLANGASGVAVGTAQEAAFQEALTEVLLELAKMVARDGEGATKLITVRVSGAPSEDAALRVSRTIASSPLVKTAIHGCDANWGRIVAAAGRSGVTFQPERLAVALNGVRVLEPGCVSSFSEDDARRGLGEEEVVIDVHLGEGTSTATTWTCDLTKAYVDINASYRS